MAVWPDPRPLLRPPEYSMTRPICPITRDPGEHAHQPDVDAHVVIEYMTVLVSDHALQLVAREMLECATGHHHHGFCRPGTGDEGVDGRFIVEDVERRHRRTRCNRHLFRGH